MGILKMAEIEALSTRKARRLSVSFKLPSDGGTRRADSSMSQPSLADVLAAAVRGQKRPVSEPDAARNVRPRTVGATRETSVVVPGGPPPFPRVGPIQQERRFLEPSAGPASSDTVAASTAMASDARSTVRPEAGLDVIAQAAMMAVPLRTTHRIAKSSPLPRPMQPLQHQQNSSPQLLNHQQLYKPQQHQQRIQLAPLRRTVPHQYQQQHHQQHHQQQLLQQQQPTFRAAGGATFNSKPQHASPAGQPDPRHTQLMAMLHSVGDTCARYLVKAGSGSSAPPRPPAPSPRQRHKRASLPRPQMSIRIAAQ
eukprot:TRINITY_DN8814_c0_g1_i1.p1 TRINITY_DN8814_c0_g1~~TRINITY_DN8814_c0_g1_i1.p1  ORF type:complete len:338 (+),score=51.36 TRINITY_DN8814_c0_g1_i1:85-1014(+)